MSSDHNEFQDSQNYKVRACLRRERGRERERQREREMDGQGNVLLIFNNLL